MSAYVELIDRDGISVRMPVSSAEMILGRSANVELSVPNQSELELEHLLLMPRGKSGCWVSSVEGSAVPVTHAGRPFQAGVVKWGDELCIGSLVLRFQSGEESQRRGPSIHPAILLTALFVAGFAAFSFFQRQSADASIDTGRSRAHVALFGNMPACDAGDDTRKTARRVEEIAHTRGDRYAYDPTEGITAVSRYHEAASCFDLAGAKRDAQRMRANAQEMRDLIESDYAAARLNLAHAIETKQWRDASKESLRLLLLTEHTGDNDYVNWLRMLNRQIALKVTHD